MDDVRDRLIWVDIETFGLDPVNDPILEVGFKITDLDLHTQNAQSWTVWDSPTYDERYEAMLQNAKDEYVLEMHKKSGLWRAARQYGKPILIVEREINNWLQDHEVYGAEEPLCGSSVDFDRGMFGAQMPTVFNRFHYRVIDNSTLKELCKRYAPDIYSKMDVQSRKIHRVSQDLEDTIQEFKFYRDNFIWDTRKLDHE